MRPPRAILLGGIMGINGKIYKMKPIEKAIKTHALTKGEIITLLNIQDASLLYEAADRVRRESVGDGVHLRGLIEISTVCKQNCLYCGLRRDNKKIFRSRMTPKEIITHAHAAAKAGYTTLVLQGGEEDGFGADNMAGVIKEIKRLGLAVTLSLGEKSFEEYSLYRQAGADRYLLRIETTDKALYEKLDPGMSFENRLRCLKDLGRLGYEVGSGFMVGLPGQSVDSIADDILFLKALPVHMAGIGPFIANPDTPLANCGKDNFDLSLKAMAVIRLLMPYINIPATTAMETLRPDGRFIALKSGANVIMPNVGGDMSEYYRLYPGKAKAGEVEKYRAELEKKLKAIGRHIAEGPGISKAYLAEDKK